MASLLLVTKGWLEEQHNLEQMRKIAMETATTPIDEDIHRTTAPLDSRKLRGWPCIAHSVTGAIEGTTAGTDAHVDRLSR